MIKGFKTKEDYLKYIIDPSSYQFTDANKIKLRDNTVFLRKVETIARTSFHGNPNHMKIQAYLNSKQSLNTNKKNAI